MTAIATYTSVAQSGPVTLRSLTAQATTGQTDWLHVPAWAKEAIITLNITANAGTTPTTVLTVRAPDPVTLDDTADHSVLLTSATITTASFHTYAIAPTYVTAGTDSATADSSVVQNGPLPPVIGIRVLNDRGTGDETYTYTLTVQFKGR